MKARELFRRNIPRARFWTWLSITLGLDWESLRREWYLLTPNEKRRIIEKLVRFYQVDVEYTRGNDDSIWDKASCVNQCVVTFAIMGNPYGNGLDTAKYKTAYGEYPHIDKPLGISCCLVETASSVGSDINHMVNAIMIGSNEQRLESWIFFDRLGIIKPGSRCMFEWAKIISSRKDDVIIRHNSVEQVKNKYIVEFKL